MSRKQLTITYDPESKQLSAMCEAVNASLLNQKSMEKNKQYPFKDGDQIQLLPHLYAFKIEISNPNDKKRKLLEDEDSTQPADDLLNTTTTTSESTTNNNGEPASKKAKTNNNNDHEDKKETHMEVDKQKEEEAKPTAPLVQEIIKSKEPIDKDEPNTLDESMLWKNKPKKKKN